MKKVALLTVLLVVAASAAITITFPGGKPSEVGVQVDVSITGASGTALLYVRENGTTPNESWVYETSVGLPYSGKIEITHPGNNLTLYVTGPDEGESESFDVVVGDASRWHIIAPGEVPDPGLATSTTGKHGSAEVTAGDTETYDVNLCDVWWNVVDPNPSGFTITSNNPFYNVVGTNVELRTASPPDWKVTVSGGSYASDESSVKVNPGPATQLLILCLGDTAKPGDTDQYGGKTDTPLRASLGSEYLVEVLAVDKCWNQDPNYFDPDVNVYAGEVNLTDALVYPMNNGTTGDTVNVDFKAVNTEGEYIGAQGSKGLKTAYSTRVIVDPGVDSLYAYLTKPIVPIGVKSTLKVEAYVAGKPLESGLAYVELVSGPEESFHIENDEWTLRVVDGNAETNVWADAETTYTIRVTAGDQSQDLALTVQELKKLLVAPNPYKYSVHGDIPINFIYKVEQIGQGGASEVVLLIADPFGNIVYRVTYDLSAPQTDPGQQTIPWYRTNSKGNRIASGMYQAVLKITLINGETKVLKKNFMVIW